MKVVLIIIAALTGYSAFAGQEYKQLFLVNGKSATAEEAIIASLRGAEAFKCVSIEAKLSKAGTSIGLKNIKKPKQSK